MSIKELEDFIEKFKQIPEENVIDGEFTNQVDSCCVLGHYHRLKSDNPNDYSADNCNDLIDHVFGGELRRLGLDYDIALAEINNGNWCMHTYPQKTPKQRSLAALNDLLNKMKDKHIS